ncbi:hypothetical protein JTE90_006927 [Oedothorax gibbosus]|uniref:YLP motif-containing protein 1 n=1 Tax=Oedothorax gibbosus TaxID=931172 RepID=A0AAV6VQP7_9ARAC|nr:hypothetical protein JTE90_006927 [Oedothorax gibbosus]
MFVFNPADNFSTELSGVTEPIIFSQVSVQTYDYGHGLEPMTSSVTAAREKDPELPPPKKVFNYGHRGGVEEPEFLDQERFPPFSDDRNQDRDFDRYRSREFDDWDSRNFRGRDFDDRDKDLRSRYFGNREQKDIGGRDSKNFRDRDSKDFADRDSKDFRDRDSRDFRDRDSKVFSEPKVKEYIEPDAKERESLTKDLKSRYFGNRDSKVSASRDHGDRDLDLRDSKRGRDRYRDDDDARDKKSRWDPTDEPDRNGSRDLAGKKESFDKKALDVGKSQSRPFKSEEATPIDDLLMPPKRTTRPKQIVIVLRGIPGSGKTHVAKLIKDKEVENGGSAPRILSLDDYFMAEQEVNDIDPDTGKKVKRKEFKYEYEAEMEETYRSSLFKSFKKTIDDRFFPFIIVDAINNKTKHYEQYWSYAKPRGFEVYIAELDSQDPNICFKRNTHERTLEDITKLLITWENKPKHFMALDVRSLLQEAAITEVEMEVETDDKKDIEEIDLGSPKDDAEEVSGHVPSRWEKFEATEEKLLQLDGLRVKKNSSMEDYLQLPDDYENRKCEPGKKRVRWADLEERKEQDRLRAIGFVVGQTDWNKMTDPSHADRALTKTKFF